MTLLITLIAAVISTVAWYVTYEKKELLLGTLSLIYWGASLMWLTDAIFEYAELGSEYFEPSVKDMINDAFLGLSAAVLGLIIWLVILLIKDPKGSVKKALTKKM